MKIVSIIGLILVTYTATFAQQKDHHNLRGPGQKLKTSTSSLPLRGQKDTRPKQFASVPPALFKNVDLSQKFLNLNKLIKGDRESFEVANLKPMSGILISTTQTAAGSSYAFRIENEQYAGAILFIKILKKKDDGYRYVGHVIRPGYSDILQLQNLNGRLFFAAEEAHRVVLD